MTMMERLFEGANRRRAAVAGAAVLAATLGAYALTSSGEESDAAASAAAEASTAQAVTVEAAAATSFARTITIAGEARPRNDVRVFSPAAGTRVLQLLVDEGDYVKVGQPLARLDTALATAQVRSGQAAVKEAEVAAIRARAEFDRAFSIADSGALSAEAIDARRAGAEAAEARLSAAQAQLAEINARLQGGYIRAQSAGLVIERPAEIGQLVDGQLLFRIAQDNVLEVAVEVSETDMLALERGQRATVRMIDGTEIEAKLRRPPASIDSRTRTGEALFSLAAHPKLRAGMFLRGEARLPATEQLSVPQVAVQFDDGEAFVYVVDENDRARRTDVELGARDGERVAVTNGLPTGARVIAGGAAFIQDGDQVRATQAATLQPRGDAGSKG
jgi:RND family efflux transporter MFP subunit